MKKKRQLAIDRELAQHTDNADDTLDETQSVAPTSIRIAPRPIENRFFLKISKRFRAARFATILLLILFVLTMLTFFGSEITIENFKYLMKYLDVNVITAPDEFQSVGYESGTEMSFGFYKGDFAVLTENGLSLYDQMATESMNVPMTMSSPSLAISEQYMLCYDRGGYGYSLFNSFSVLYSGTMEYPIYIGDICDTGSYVLVSRNLSYLSAIYVYDHNFNLIAELQKDKYVMSVDLSEDGERLLVLSMYGNTAGQYCGELQLISVKDGVILHSVDFTDTLPIQAVFNADGVSVLRNDRFSFYDPELKPVGKEAIFDSDAVSLYTMGSDFCAVAISENVIGYQNSILLFSNTGEKLADYRVAGQLTKLVSKDDRFYLLTIDKLYRGGKDGILDYIDIDKGALDVITNEDGNMIFCCYSNRAVTVSFEEEEDTTSGVAPEEQIK